MNETQSLLQRFFDASLIPSETTDERLKHYQSAAADLAKRFIEKSCDAASASRVAIDPNCPATDPWFEIVQEAVKVYWKTFLLKNYDGPRQICRAILLEALSKASEEDWTATFAIWYASSSLLPYLGDGPELEIVREFIGRLGKESEAESSTEWQLGLATIENLPEFDIKVPAIKTIQVDEKELTSSFEDAVGPQNSKGTDNGNPNPFWPTSNVTQWAYNFSPRAATGVATAVNKALAATAPAIKGLTEQLAPALKKHSKELSKSVIASGKRHERFTELLWWKEAVYSPTLQRSYRDFSPAGIAVTLSFDLSAVSGTPVPLSVEFFLREAARNVLPENPKLTLIELVADLKKDKALTGCLPTAPTGDPRRISLRAFLSVAQQVAPPEDVIPTFVGIAPQTSLPVSEWAVWLYRERLSELVCAPET